MRPTLPRIPTKAIHVLSVAWITKLINCLEWAMNYPTGDDKTTYRNGETISALRQSGAAATNASGDTYKGHFKVIQTAPNKIKIINGINADDTNCFKGYINKIKKTIPIQEEITITAAGVLYLEFVPVGSKPITGFTCTFKQASELPAYDESKGFEQISQILFSDGKITDFSQPTGINSRIIYWGAC